MHTHAHTHTMHTTNVMRFMFTSYPQTHKPIYAKSYYAQAITVLLQLLHKTFDLQTCSHIISYTFMYLQGDVVPHQTLVFSVNHSVIENNCNFFFEYGNRAMNIRHFSEQIP